VLAQDEVVAVLLRAADGYEDGGLARVDRGADFRR